MATALVPLAEGFEEIEAVSIVDVLRRGGVEVVTAAVGDRLEVSGAHGMALRADALLADVAGREYDAIVLPGGGEGTEALKRCEPLLERLRRQHESGGVIGAICAAPLVLVAAGVAAPDVQITCYPTCQIELDHEWTPVPVVADRNLITGQAPGCAILFALVVLQALAGQAEARRVARGMVADAPA